MALGQGNREWILGQFFTRGHSVSPALFVEDAVFLFSALFLWDDSNMHTFGSSVSFH